MDILERKRNLLKHSAAEIRGNRDLFAEFVFIRQSEGGNKAECLTCKFGTIFNQWTRDVKKNFKTETMANNTFKLKDEKGMYYMPSGKVLTKNSPDELAFEYLNAKGAGVDSKARENIFEKLPVKKETKNTKKVSGKK